MGDKKRKVIENNPEEAVQPEGKKAKREEKKEKKEKKHKSKDVVEEVKLEEPSAKEQSKSDKKEKVKKDKKEKKEKAEKEEKKDKKERKERKEKEKKEKKEKSQDDTLEVNGAEEKPEATDAMDVDEKPAGKAEKTEKTPEEKRERREKSKLLKKAKKEKKRAEAAQNESQQQKPESNEEQSQAAEDNTAKKGSRFICFVGNLPYSANQESLTAHFEKIAPVSIRVATQKEKPTKCRGFGFIEFDNYDRMKTCLKLYHHSMFDDKKYPPRRINVELTAGGGGNTDARKAKIEAKNKKLFEERQRNAKEIQKEKDRRDKAEETGNDEFAGVHPSRLSRMN
ncbi:hypothetical protein BBP40_001026 [Aspergillus hancockii]|nr:hypothetical protein BBP40_001026 [Aspergillus hancockii]